ncbi:MAG: MerR family transcriptional regulator [Leptospiraceae bacterium]|nr:MerR family transcriptional regulator [Leptospiraceae bacterium]
MMYSIGQFSLITRISVRTLRKYHQSGLLEPDYIDEDSGYRYYKEGAIERAQVITSLRELNFALKDIKAILASCAEDDDILDRLIEQQALIQQELSRMHNIQTGLEQTIALVRERQQIPVTSNQIVIREVDPVAVGLIRQTGPWSGIGVLFRQAGRRAGRQIGGPALSLCYDGEYRDEADYAAGFILKKKTNIKGLQVLQLAKENCLCVIHNGSYQAIGSSYERAMAAIQEQKLSWSPPTREIYHKGPGMIFKGKAQKYVTEIQIPVQSVT